MMLEESMPLVSVVMPVFNAETFVADSIASVLVQTYRRFELIIVDDGSTDRSAAIINGITDGRIQYHHQQNGGVSKARNRGVQQSQGELIAFLDSDDLWVPEKLAKQVAYLQSHEDVGVVYCWLQVLYPGKPLVALAHRVSGNPREIISDGYGLFPSATMLRREVFEKSGGFDEGFVGSEFEDIELSVRLSEITTFDCISESLAIYRSPERKKHSCVQGKASAQYLCNRGMYLEKCLARYQHDPAVVSALNFLVVGHWSDLGQSKLREGLVLEGRKTLVQALRLSLENRTNAKMFIRTCGRLIRSIFQ